MKPHFLFAALLVITSCELTFSQSATLITTNANNGILSQNTIVVNSDPGTISLPVSGTGTRLMWIPAKSAFRVGTVYGMEWDINNMGLWSFASGLNTIASSWTSTAMGFDTKASNFHSTAIGYSTTASGFSSTALGYLTTASGGYSTAMGYGTIISAQAGTAIGTYNIDVTNALLVVGNGNFSTRSNALTVLSDGKTGIGTNSPLAPLHVAGSNVLNSGIQTAYWFGAAYNTGTTINLIANGSWATGLLVDFDIVGKRSIVSAQNVTTSDARIKNILRVSDNQQDLETLRRLKITDYRYKDVANWGNQTFKKVIAQQVEEVYPQAVRKQTSTLPDIYCLAEKVAYDESGKELTVTLSKDYGIKVGDKLEMIHAEKGKMQAEVIAVSGNGFTVKDWHYPTDKIFVFGREVNDFRVVDYEALSMLGISATQALLQRLEQAESKNQTLHKELIELKENTNRRFEQLEAVLNREK